MQHDDNLTAKLPSFVTHLECAMTGERYESDQVHNLSRAGKPLLVRYDLAKCPQGAEQRDACGRGRSLAITANCCRFAKLRTSSAWAAMTPIVRMPRGCREPTAR